MLKKTCLLWLVLLSPNLLATSPATLQFSSATYSINKDGGTVEITVSRVGGSHKAVSVQYASKDDTVTAGEDYTEVKKGKLSWGRQPLNKTRISSIQMTAR